MKTIKLLTLLVLFSLQAGATGYSHNMFVAHKKLQAGKECNKTQSQPTTRKVTISKIQSKISAVAKSNASITVQLSDKFSEAVTLNQRILQQDPSSLFVTPVDEEKMDTSIVSQIVVLIKGAVFAFLASLAM